jgi:hypothetical protein
VLPVHASCRFLESDAARRKNGAFVEIASNLYRTQSNAEPGGQNLCSFGSRSSSSVSRALALASGHTPATSGLALARGMLRQPSGIGRLDTKRKNMSNRFASLVIRLAEIAGLCVVIVLGVEAALTRDSACRTLFAITLGVALASVVPSTSRRTVSESTAQAQCRPGRVSLRRPLRQPPKARRC